MKIFLAELSYGNPEITAFEVDEKPKSYKVKSSAAVVGFPIWAKSISKSDTRIYISLSGAIFALEKLAKEYADVKEEEFRKALETWKQIHDVAIVTRSDPDKIAKIVDELQNVNQ